MQEHITTVFVFEVFLISLLTKGYVYGILAAFAGTIAVNYAFTFPYFVLNFTIPVNFFSGIIMIIISILTSALTTKLKQHEATNAESERERMRANLLRAVSHDLRTSLTTIYASIIKAIWGGIAHEGSMPYRSSPRSKVTTCMACWTSWESKTMFLPNRSLPI